MENLTPGRKLILDLLAKSVAKIQAAEAENEVKVEHVKIDGRKGKMKREVPEELRKKIKTEKKVKENIDATKEEELKIIPKMYAVKTEQTINMDKNKRSVKKGGKVSLRKENGFDESDNLGTKEMRPEELQINFKKGKRMKKKKKENVDTTSVKIKSEYTEIKTEEIDLEIYVKPELKDNKLTSSSISRIVKIENNKDSIDVIENSDIFEQTTKVKDVEKNVKKKEPVKQCLKKEYLRLELDSTLISKEKSNVLAQGHKRESSKKHYIKRKSGFSSKRFSPEEDKIILDLIEEFGDKIDIAQIAEDLQRTVKSIGHEVRKLKAGKEKEKRRVRKYTLSEDLVVLDAVLKKLGEDY